MKPSCNWVNLTFLKIYRRRSTTTESSSDDESKIDQEMEDRLNSVASKINLTPNVVKNILKVCLLDRICAPKQFNQNFL